MAFLRVGFEKNSYSRKAISAGTHFTSYPNYLVKKFWVFFLTSSPTQARRQIGFQKEQLSSPYVPLDNEDNLPREEIR